jgi:hypothetical protein
VPLEDISATMNRYALSAVRFGHSISIKCIYKERLQINGYTITSIGEAYTASMDTNERQF